MTKIWSWMEFNQNITILISKIKGNSLGINSLTITMETRMNLKATSSQIKISKWTTISHNFEMMTSIFVKVTKIKEIFLMINSYFSKCKKFKERTAATIAKNFQPSSKKRTKRRRRKMERKVEKISWTMHLKWVRRWSLKRATTKSKN